MTIKAEPILLTGWTINWGDGSDPETFPVTPATPTVNAGHYFDLGTTPSVSISAMTAGFGNIIPLGKS